MDLGQDRTHLPAATPASLTARVMRTWSLIDTTDSHLVIVVVGNLRKLPGDTHVILASGACLGGTGSTPDRSRSVDDDGGQGSPILYIQTPDQPHIAAASKHIKQTNKHILNILNKQTNIFNPLNKQTNKHI